MSVLTMNDLTERLKERFGESEDENDIAFMEDITDTFNDLSTNANAQELNTLKTKYSDLQKKYRDRFFNKGASDDQDDLLRTTPEPEKKRYTFEALFKGKE